MDEILTDQDSQRVRSQTLMNCPPSHPPTPSNEKKTNASKQLKIILNSRQHNCIQNAMLFHLIYIYTQRERVDLEMMHKKQSKLSRSCLTYPKMSETDRTCKSKSGTKKIGWGYFSPIKQNSMKLEQNDLGKQERLLPHKIHHVLIYDSHQITCFKTRILTLNGHEL